VAGGWWLVAGGWRLVAGVEEREGKGREKGDRERKGMMQLSRATPNLFDSAMRPHCLLDCMGPK